MVKLSEVAGGGGFYIYPVTRAPAQTRTLTAGMANPPPPATSPLSRASELWPAPCPVSGRWPLVCTKRRYRQVHRRLPTPISRRIAYD